MENVVLIVHLLLALALVGVVLLQRSEGGGLGIGGGGGAVSGRSPSTAMGKVTWFLAVCFITTSITLTIIAAEKSAGTSVIDRLSATPPALNQNDTDLPSGSDLLPPVPGAGNEAPLVPAAD